MGGAGLYSGVQLLSRRTIVRKLAIFVLLASILLGCGVPAYARHHLNEEARQAQRAFHRTLTQDTVIRYIGPAGGGD